MQATTSVKATEQQNAGYGKARSWAQREGWTVNNVIENKVVGQKQEIPPNILRDRTMLGKGKIKQVLQAVGGGVGSEVEIQGDVRETRLEAPGSEDCQYAY